MNLLPPQGSHTTRPTPQISWNYTTFLNITFFLVTAVLALLAGKSFWQKQWKQFWSAKKKLGQGGMERALTVLAILSLVWLIVGVLPF